MDLPEPTRSQEPEPWRRWVFGALGIAVGVAVVLFCVLHLFVATSEGAYENARSAVALTGIAGAAVLAAVALLRLHATDREHQLARDRHDLERDKHDHAIAEAAQARSDRDEDMARVEVSALRARYTTAAEQLGHSSPAIRLAGVYAMAALADDWVARGNDSEVQTCIDVLCSIIRTPPPADLEEHEQRADLEVRQTITRTISAHLQPGNSPSWHGRDFDFTGATFIGQHSFAGAQLACRMTFDSATFADGTVSFDGSTFAEGRVTFDRAHFAGGRVIFDGSEFGGGAVSFDGAKFAGCHVTFDRARFTGGTVTFLAAEFADGFVSFAAHFNGATVTFKHGQFTGGTVMFEKSKFEDGNVHFDFARVTGGRVLLGNSWFIGANVTFDYALVDGGRMTWVGAAFAGGRVSLHHCHFASGIVRFRAHHNGMRWNVEGCWQHPGVVVGDWSPNPPTWWPLPTRLKPA